MRSLFLDESGMSFVWILVIIFLGVVVISLGLEVYRDFSLQESLTTSLNRACNISVSVSMLDEYRSEKIAKIDAERARLEFLGCINYDLDMPGSYPIFRLTNDDLEYEIVFTNLYITEEPPEVKGSAVLKVKPYVFGNWLFPGFFVEMPLSFKSKNVRIEGFK
jgi:hypothetical protein